MTRGNILVVEDENITAIDLQNRLESMGFEVPVIVSSGEDAILKAEENRPDLVLMDIVIKGELDGIDAAEHIRNNFDIPVVYLTAYADDLTLHRAKVTEPFGYIIKPCEERELYTTVEMALNKHKLEKKLKASEQKYRNLVDNAIIGVYRTNLKGEILFVNDAMVKMLEFGSSDKLIESGVMTTYKDQDDRKGFIAKLKTSKKLNNFELNLQTKTGKIKRVLVSASLEGEEILGMILDLTAHKSAEEAIRESEEKFRSISATAQDAIVMVDIKGKITYWNEAAKKIFKYTDQDFREKNLHEFILPSPDYETYKKGLDKFFKNSQRESIGKTLEMIGLKKDGTEFPIELSMSAVSIKGKWNAVSIIRDITERKLAIDQIKKSLKEKELLLQEVHHRVKNNMQIISSLLKLQAGNIDDNRTVELFKDSQNRIKSMALVHEKLYQSKDFATINFNEYIQTMVHSLFRSYKISTSKIKLKANIEDVTLSIDHAIPCGLIINELISNSLKYAFPKNKQGKIEIGLHQLDTGQVELVVNDNGIGIPEKIDFRNTQSLGLHLVNLLAEDQLEGKIDLDRSHGSKFTIKFEGVS